MSQLFESTAGLLLTEEDVSRLFNVGTEKTLQSSGVTKALRALGTLAVVLAVAYAAINAPALWMQTKFYVQTQVLPASSDTNPGLPMPVPGATNSTSNSSASTAPQRQYKNNYLYIDRIHVEAPIIWNNPDDNDSVLNALKNGVVHLAGNPTPDQPGNVFIVGHSSDFPWHAGNYKQIFALLPQLKIGDSIVVVYNNKPIQYVVSDTRTVNPDDISIRQNTTDSTLSLMTCVPIGTALRRLDVVAKAVVQPTGTTNQLPF